MELQKLDLLSLQKQLEIFEKADEDYQNHHDAILDQDEDLNVEQYELEFIEHQNIVQNIYVLSLKRRHLNREKSWSKQPVFATTAQAQVYKLSQSTQVQGMFWSSSLTNTCP